MEMQFDRIPVPYLQKVAGDLRFQEQTLEVRLPDGMPDIGRVLGAWGQVIIRGKEWNSDTMAVSCGVMAWVLYTPEDGEGVRSVEAWLPFQMKWDLPETHHDGKILLSCLLQGIDARSISARKLMLRANLSALAEGWLSQRAQVAVPGQLPDDVSVLTATYPVQLLVEAGEKAFLLEEQLTPSAGGAKPEKILYYSLQPEIIDKKVMAGKVVFRGSAIVHILYRGEDEKLYTWDGDIPFSQYADLDREYEDDPAVWVHLCVTSLDISPGEEGFVLKAGLLGQYMLYDRTLVTVAGDAYSPRRAIELQSEELQLPAVLERSTQVLRGEVNVQADAQQLVDVCFYPSYRQPRQTDDGVTLFVPGQFQMLYYDTEGQLCGTVTPWEGEWTMQMAPDSAAKTYVVPSGKPSWSLGAGNINMRADVCADTVIMSGQGIPMLTGMALGEPEKPNPDRPGLVVCKKGDKRLWDLAKETGSTVDMILKTNRLEAEPDGDQVLLIPIP